MTTLGTILAKEDHKAPGKSLAGDDSRRHGKTLAGASARPLPGPRQDPCRGYGEALAKDTRRATIRPTPVPTSSTVRMQLPTQPVGQAPAWRQVDLRGDPPLRHSATCLPTWHHEHRWPGRVSTRKGAATDETGLSPVPDKARAPKQDALNAPCHVMRGINSYHCALSTSCVPLWQPLAL